MEKAEPSCPVCGQGIVSPTRVRNWDTLLNQIYNLLPEGTRQNREQILKQRPEHLKAWYERKASSNMRSVLSSPVVSGEQAETGWYDLLPEETQKNDWQIWKREFFNLLKLAASTEVS